MKKILNNKIYDTEKSERVFEYRHKWLKNVSYLPINYGFVEWEDATIYKTKKGNYFIYFNQSGYAERERIEETTLDNVKRIISELNPDEYLELFGTEELEEA